MNGVKCCIIISIYSRGGQNEDFLGITNLVMLIISNFVKKIPLSAILPFLLSFFSHNFSIFEYFYLVITDSRRSF